MNPADTIVAVSSAAGPAARMIVRASGPAALALAADLSRLSPAGLPACAATRVRLHFACLAVPAWVYAFHAPRSYTGDDVVEFHVPGNPLLVRMLVDHLRAAGARTADPGEFTARAFFNGRVNLLEAEGVAATIAAGNEQELTAARQLMAGELARRLRPAMDEVAETLALVEAGIDFADEEGVSFLSAEQVRQRVARADEVLGRLLDASARFDRLAHEPSAVLVGRPNAGKSTLLNALAGRERAVTSPIAGTTRDAISADVTLPRGVVRIIDVAGLDEPAAGGPEDEVARQMYARAMRAIESADVVLHVREVTDDRPAPRWPRDPGLVILSKADLSSQRRTDSGRDGPVVVSAVTGQNLDELRRRLDRLLFGAPSASPAALVLNARHVDAVRAARSALARAAERSGDASPELLALELREGLDAIGGVLGAVTPDDLLGRIFSTFCIGK